MRKSRATLWTRNFTTIIIGTVISAIGSTAMNFVLGLVVFDNTASTFLSGLFMAVSMIPSVVLPLFVAPIVDRCSRKNIIVLLDLLSGLLYIGFGLFLRGNDFSYLAYMCFSLIMGTIGSIYSLAYQALYPDLIEKGFEQKGYSISSLIYPSVTALFTPLASLVYVRFGIPAVVLSVGFLLLIAAAFESQIRWKPLKTNTTSSEGSWLSYWNDVFEGVRYVKKEAGIRNIYLYMSVTQASGEGSRLMIMAFFQSSPVLGTAMYSLLISAETLGRMIGGLLHYFIKIPEDKRYAITEKVYLLYNTLDGILLFTAYPLMLINRFLCGFMGVNSATLREASVQRYLPSNIRARVNAFFNVLISSGVFLIQLAAGALGEIFSYQTVTLAFAIFGTVMFLLLVVRNRSKIAMIYRGTPDTDEKS